MRTKKKNLTNKTEVEGKETKALEEVIVTEAKEVEPEQKEKEIKEEEKVQEETEENKEETIVSKKRSRTAEPKEIVSKEEAPKKRGRKVGTRIEEKKAAEKKTVVKKAAETTEEVIVLQFSGKEVSANDIISQVKDNWVQEGHRAASIKKLELYIKPEEFAAYYVINEKNTGKIDL